MLKEKTSLDDLTIEALKVRDTLLSRLESKGLGEASMPLERIGALLDPRRNDCSEEHLLNGSAALKADAIADVNVAKTFVDPIVVPASPAEDGSGSSGGDGGSGSGASGGSGSGSGEPNQPPPKRQRPSALGERRVQQSFLGGEIYRDTALGHRAGPADVRRRRPDPGEGRILASRLLAAKK